MADEVLALHTQLCGRIEPDLNETLISRLRSLPPDEGRTLRERCLASQTAESINLLGLWYLYTPSDEDPARAVEWFRKSADLGNPVAMHYLGIALQTGHGVPQDKGLGVEWFQRSADLGNPMAMNQLADCYERGNGIPEDRDKAIDWYRRSGTAHSLWNLANLLEKEDPVMALRLISRAHSLYITNEDQRECRDQITNLLVESRVGGEVLANWTRDAEELEATRLRVRDLEAQLEDLRAELDYRPGGPGYDEAHAHWVRCRDTTKIENPSP